MIQKYKHAILGGTFDQLHVGHKKLIDAAFEKSEKVTIGITTPEMNVDKFLSKTIEDFSVRKNFLIKYLKKKSFLSRSVLIPINDIYGNSLTEKNIQAIFVVKTTSSNARLINVQRKQIGLKPLKIITVPFVKGDSGKIITSESIRYGEIDRHGRAYFRVFKSRKKLLLPEYLREELRKPAGFVIRSQEKIQKLFTKNKIPMVIAVGDVVSILLTKAGYQPDISIIDFKTRRKPIDKKHLSKLLNINVNHQSCINNPGTINIKAVNTYRLALKKYFTTHEKQIIVVKGEEDLLALPAILFAPLLSIVVYGQYQLGSVVVETTEQKKKQVLDLLRKFND